MRSPPAFISAARDGVMSDARRDVILFHSPASDPSWRAELAREFPRCLVVDSLDGIAPERVVAAIVWRYPAGMLQPLANLRIIQVLGAGVDHIVADDRLPPDVPVARLVDEGLSHSMSIYVAMHALALHRRAPELRRAQAERRWTYIHPVHPSKTCIGLIGLGVLGLACAQRLTSLGFSLAGWSRSPKQGLGFPTYAGTQELETFQQRVDCYVLLLPITPVTANLIDRAFLARIKPGSTLINVGRGGLVDDAALLDALDSGALRHAVLDVFRTEPLPADHPFWTHPGVTVTPHNSSGTNPSTALVQIVDNVRQALRGQLPANLVDLARGY